MKIKRLAVNNFKGFSREIVPEPVNVLSGANGSGKTSLLWGLRWAITGDTPLGTRPDTASPLIGKQSGGVEVELDDGFLWSRKLTRKKGGGVTQTFSVNGKKVAAKEAQELLLGKVGDYAPMFDIGKFLGLSPEKKREFVLGLSASTECDAAELEAELARKTFTQVDEPLSFVSRTIAAALSDDDFGGRAESDVLAGMVVSLRKYRNDRRKAQREKVESVRSLTDEKNTEFAVNQTTAELHEERDEMLRTREAAKEKIAGQASRDKAVTMLKSSIQRAVRATEKLEAEKNALPVVTPEDLEEAKIQHMPNVPPPDDYEIAYQTSQKNTRALRDQLVRAEAEYSSQVAALEHLRAQPDEWRDIILELSPILESFEKLHQSSNNGFVDDVLARVQRVLDLATTNSTQSNEEAAKTRQAELVVKVSAIGKEWDAAKDRESQMLNVWDQSRRARERIATERAAIEERIAKLQDGYDKRAAMGQRLQQAFDEKIEKERELAEFMQGNTSLPVESLQQQVDLMDEHLKEQDDRLSNARKYEGLIEVIRREQQASRDLEREIEVAGFVLESACELRDNAMTAALAPLTGGIDEFLTKAEMPYPSYCKLFSESGSPVFELGWVKDGVCVSLDALSGGEAALFSTGVAYSLVSQSDSPLKMLLLEAAEMDDELFGQVIKSVSAVDGIDQCFIARPTIPANVNGDANYLSL